MKIILLFLLILLLAKISHAESIALNWDAPTTNVDSTPLMDLGGFKVYWGTETGVYTNNMDVGNILCYVVSGLTVGFTYYFAATAYDTLMNESSYSNEVNKLIASGDIGNCALGNIHFNWKGRTKQGGFNGGFQ